jgi:hypothetical protein
MSAELEELKAALAAERAARLDAEVRLELAERSRQVVA